MASKTNSNSDHSRKQRAAAAKSRNTRLIEDGYTRFIVQLSPEATATLASERAKTGESKNAVVNRLLLETKKI